MKNKNLIEKLSNLAVDYNVFLIKVLNFHWNIKGRHFFALHEKLEDYYEASLEELDEIAERIFMIGGEFSVNLTYCLAESTIKETEDYSDEENAVEELVKDYANLKGQMEATAKIADEQSDRGTAALMDELIASIEKRIWMLQSFDDED
ncbi:DNA starvation/stationary phase protection protein [Candidatus Dojkabacteria bacterium]|nr:DNA starvation/stationary phase protection protein [Candidatus Dojkabacteria bacterium]